MPDIPQPGGAPPPAGTETISWQELMAQVGTALTPLPVADYPLVVEKAEATRTKNGKLMFKLTYRVEDSHPTHANRKVWNQLVLSPENPNALTIFFGQLATHGLDATFFATNPPPETVANALVGRRVFASIGQRTWNGSLQNEVKSYKPSGMAVPTIGVPVLQAAPPPPAPAQAAVPQPVFQAPVAAPPPPPVAAAPVAAPAAQPVAAPAAPPPPPPPPVAVAPPPPPAVAAPVAEAPAPPPPPVAVAAPQEVAVPTAAVQPPPPPVTF